MSIDRKAAVAAYKERKASAGVYVLRCAPSNEAWVGTAPDLGTIENRLRFALRMAATPHRSLQAAAKAHGADAFSYEVLERVEEKDASPELIRKLLKTRQDHWADALGATRI